MRTGPRYVARRSRRMLLVPALTLVAGAGLAAVASAAMSTPPGRDLGSLGGGDSAEATDVDGDVVVGWSDRPETSKRPAVRRAFAYDLNTGTMRGLGTLGGLNSEASAVDGQTVVGTSLLRPSSVGPRRPYHAFAYDLGTGTMRDLGGLGGSRHSYAVDVSGRVVVGYSAPPHSRGTRAFAYDLDKQTMRNLGTLGGDRSRAVAVDGDIVVGASTLPDGANPSGGGEHAFAYDLSAGTMRDLGTLGSRISEPVAVDGDTVVGWSYLAGNTATHAFAYDLATGTMRDLGTLGGRDSSAVDVDGDTVVGWAWLAGNTARHAFAYDLGKGTMRDLGALNVDGVQPPTDSVASAVDGDIVVGLSANRDSDFDLTRPGSGTAVAYDLRTGGIVALGDVRDESHPVAVSGGVVAGLANTLEYDSVEDEWWVSVRHPAAWSLGVAFAEPSVTVAEDAGTAQLVVQRGGDTTAPATVDYAQTGGTATPGTDFTLEPGSLTFAADETTKTISVPVADDATREAAESIVVTLTPRDTATMMGAPTTTRVSIQPSDQQPDARISTHRSSGYVGAGVLNSTGDGQSRRLPARRGDTRSFYVRVGNPGNAHNTFVLTAAPPASGSQVRYFVGGRDVTAALRSPEGLRTTRRPSASTLVRVSVKARSTAALGSVKPATVTATWTGDVQRSDTVRAAVRVVR